MRIAIATAVYHPQINGVAVFSHNLARGLAARGHDVLVICPSLDGRSSVGAEDGVQVARLKSVEIKMYPDQVHTAQRKGLFYRHGFKVSVFPQAEVKRILGDFQPEVVHVQVSDPIGLSVVAWARAHAVPVVTTEHNQPEVLTDPLKMPRILKKPANALLQAYFVNRQSKSDFVTMPTKKAILAVLGGGGAGGVLKGTSDSGGASGVAFGGAVDAGGGLRRPDGSVVPVAAVSNGVDLSHFKPLKLDSAEYDELCARYKLYKDCPTALYVGRLDPEKNVGAVIEAFKLALARIKARNLSVNGARFEVPITGVDQRRPNKMATGVNGARLKVPTTGVDEAPAAQLLIVGDGVDRPRLEALAKGCPEIHFAGRVVAPELYKVYSLADVFVTASEIETQGIVLVEAAACGLPLIAVDAGAVAEICKDGENGFLCRPRDITGVAEAMVEILTDADLRARFSKKSLELAREHDLEKTLDKFENIYEHVKLYKDF